MSLERQDINVAICGHAWHGKSTLLGKTLVDIGQVPRNRLRYFVKKAEEARDRSFVFALMMFRGKDASKHSAEAEKGITIHPSRVRFEFEDHFVTIIDTPGQETYTNNRFYAMFQADTVVLVVDVREGVQPVTEQILRILVGMSIPLSGVCVSKMDKVDYSRDDYLACVDEVKMALEEYQVPTTGDIPFVPTSAWAPGRELLEPAEGTVGYQRIDWYDGPALYDLLKSLDFRTIRPLAPLRIIIHSGDVYDNVPGVGKAMTGLVESGVLRKDVELLFEPLSSERGAPVTAKVRSIELTRGQIATPGLKREEIIPRQLAGIALRTTSVKDKLRPLFRGRGVVAGPVDNPPAVARRFLCELTVFDPSTTLIPGEQWVVHCHFDRVAAEIEAITHTRRERGSEWIEVPAGEEAPRIGPGEWGRLILRPVRPIAIEEAAHVLPLSRLILRRAHKPIGYGRCLKILPLEDDS